MDISSEAPKSETKAFHRRPQAFYWRPKLFIGDPNLFIGDPLFHRITPQTRPIEDSTYFLSPMKSLRSPIKRWPWGLRNTPMKMISQKEPACCAFTCQKSTSPSCNIHKYFFQVRLFI